MSGVEVVHQGRAIYVLGLIQGAELELPNGLEWDRAEAGRWTREPDGHVRWTADQSARIGVRFAVVAA
ncbi:hypothetical protein EDF22_0615 [Rathayibacter sp. PhB127]|nr:hypothetical protein EDF22_0615 [Rathayibacter sp. PhB127]